MAVRSLRSTLLRLRIISYVTFAISSSGLLAFTIVRLLYTIKPRDETSLFDGQPFYDPSVAELCFSGALALPFSLAMIFILLAKKQFNTLSRNWFEITCNSILWALWLGGSAASSAVWYDLNYCIEYSECRFLEAMLAFAWLGWICLNAQLFPSLFIVIRTRSWDEHMFDQWSPNSSGATSYQEQKAGSEANAIPWSYRAGDESRTQSYRLSSFSAVVPWLAWSEGASVSRANTPSRARTSGTRNSGMTRVTFS